MGDINISSCYSDQSKFVTRRGSMELKNMHNISSVEVSEEGNVMMQGLDGTTEVKISKGNLDMGVSRVRSESKVEVLDGNITLKLSPSHPLQLRVAARETRKKGSIEGWSIQEILAED